MSDKKNEKKAEQPVVETDAEGNVLMPPADIDGDGKLEQIPYPGPHTTPTVLPSSHDEEKKADKKSPK